MNAKTKTNLKVNNFQERINLSQKEEEVLRYWQEIDAFKRSVQERPESKPYVFYDGPPFATGLPHYGHILASTIKDVVPRYFTMKGFRVERVWGWDCHGIPIENMIEKELGLKGGKKGIEELGIDKFNASCRSAILRFDQEWEKVIDRMGRWVDFKNSYKTMDKSYMESVWWAFKSLYEKDLVYEGKRVILYCPRCATPLSNFEIAMDNSYKDLIGPSTVYKYKLEDQQDTYLLAWSTTPWNKLATPALAVNPDLTYVKVKQGNEYYILAKDTLTILNPEPAYEIVKEYQGTDLEQFRFELHYDFYPRKEGEKAGVVIADEYVTASEGTGVVTLAIYGEDDYRVMTKHNVQLVEHVDHQGMVKPEVTPFAGMFMLKVNPLVNQDLKERGLIYRDEDRLHSVPVCYRCETRLYHAPVPAWFINIQKLKPELIENNQAINWYPGHLKQGRFGKGLESAPDWNISRSRYWGTPMPVWVGEQTGKVRVIGSVAELKQWAVNPQEVEQLTDIHREFVDPIKVFVDDAKTEVGLRIPEVFDCWVESGSMPFASEHYPFERKQVFENRYPAQFIAEYIAQTRAWFYTLHVMSVGLFGKPAFENAVTTGTILAEDGTKMSKSKKNYPDPMMLIDKYGVDALRFYLMSSTVMRAENLNFSEKGVEEIKKKVFTIFWNVFSFLKLYGTEATTPLEFPQAPDHVLDQWLVSKIEGLTKSVTEAMDNYDVVSASRQIMDFVDDLSTWYLRLSRDRLRDEAMREQPLQVLRAALYRWTLLAAPFAPFFSELVYQNLVGTVKDSVHLELWPEANQAAINQQLEEEMVLVQQAVERVHAQRKEANIPLRQPLSSVVVESNRPLRTALTTVMADEVNVKLVKWEYQQPDSTAYVENADDHAGEVVVAKAEKSGKVTEVTLDTKLTPHLQAEGEARALIRKIQDARKKAGTDINELVDVVLPDWPTEFEADIKAKVSARNLIKGDQLQVLRLQTAD